MNRLELIGSVVGTVVILTFVGVVVLTVLGIATLSGVGQAWFVLLSTLVLLSAIQVFGKDVFNAFQNARGGE